MAEEQIVRFPAVKNDPVPQDWEDNIIDAPHDAPRKAVWVPLPVKAGNWYLTRERAIHDLVNAVLLEYMELELTGQQLEGQPEPE